MIPPPTGSIRWRKYQLMIPPPSDGAGWRRYLEPDDGSVLYPVPLSLPAGHCTGMQQQQHNPQHAATTAAGWPVPRWPSHTRAYTHRYEPACIHPSSGGLTNCFPADGGQRPEPQTRPDVRGLRFLSWATWLFSSSLCLSLSPLIWPQRAVTLRGRELPSLSLSLSLRSIQWNFYWHGEPTPLSLSLFM